jgi:predicted transposase YbfD/YdcC
MRIDECFDEVETTREHNGYFCSVGETITIAILGSLCGFRSVRQIQQWARHGRTAAFLREHFGIEGIPSYSWMLRLLKLIDPKSFNLCFIRWAQGFVTGQGKSLTLAIDGKEIRSTGRMDAYESPLHIVSAHVGELGVTLGQRTVDSKSNEIPAVRELIALLRIEGFMVTADAMHCQRETAAAIAAKKADYLLSVKDNQKALKEDIEDYVKDDALRRAMDTHETVEKNRGRIERRRAFSTRDVGWLREGVAWAGLACIGAIHTRYTGKKGTSGEWHHYISSRELTAEELLKHARLEWGVESMHWLLDVHFAEDSCRAEDRNVQQNLNIVRKVALNTVRAYRDKTGGKRPLSHIMLDCLIDHGALLTLLASTGTAQKHES